MKTMCNKLWRRHFWEVYVAWSTYLNIYVQYLNYYLLVFPSTHCRETISYLALFFRIGIQFLDKANLLQIYAYICLQTKTVTGKYVQYTLFLYDRKLIWCSIYSFHTFKFIDLELAIEDIYAFWSRDNIIWLSSNKFSVQGNWILIFSGAYEQLDMPSCKISKMILSVWNV